MPRYKKYDYTQPILLPIEFKKQILPGTIEYVIDYMVEKKLNIKALEARYKNDETEAPAYDPNILLKIVLLAYTRGIISSRKIGMLCNENIFTLSGKAIAKPTSGACKALCGRDALCEISPNEFSFLI